MTSSYISDAIRESVRTRASHSCEYCLLAEFAVLGSHQCDHIVARKHGGSNELSNLAHCCTICNKYKGSDLTSIDPELGNITPLFNPREQKWFEHFELPPDGVINPLTPESRVTVYLLRLNRAERVMERQLLIESGHITRTV